MPGQPKGPVELHWVMYVAGSPTVTTDDSSLHRFHSVVGGQCLFVS